MTNENPFALVPDWRCKATSVWTGERCRKARMRGQEVCGTHGGRSPQAMRKARERLNALALPAVEALHDALRSGDWPAIIAAAKTVLDRIPGFGANAKLDVTYSATPEYAEWATYATDDELAIVAEIAARAKQRMLFAERDEDAAPVLEGVVVDRDGVEI
jgi:hypothetical protein